MAHKKPAAGGKAKAKPGVKDTALYKQLRDVGVSAKKSARVAASTAETSRKKAGRPASSIADLTVPELRQRAKKAGIKGRSTMNKEQLVRALRAA
jgi:hypothetical protein